MVLHIIGLGVADQAPLEENALLALQSAGRVIGSARQLDTVKSCIGKDQKIEILPKLTELESLLADSFAQSRESIALLASGDPLFYGIGKWVARTFPDLIQHKVCFYPAVSSIQVACHHMAWALQDVTVISLHGRPALKLKTQLRPGRKLIVLSDADSSPQRLARLCVDAGYEQSTLTVCEALGYPQQKIRSFSVADLISEKNNMLSFDSLHVSCLDVQGIHSYLPRFPGIEDHLFITDRDQGKGMLTKREVRLTLLSLLQPSAGECIWDIGAGCGGVSIELSYWTPEAQVHAIEHHPERIACLKANRDRFGVVSNLHITQARAPEALTDIPDPDKVFIGGSGGELDTILSQAWIRLQTHGVIVASAVTEASRQSLYTFYLARKNTDDGDCETSEVAISRGEELAGELLYRPNLPVTIFKFTKRLPSLSNVVVEEMPS